MEGSYDTNPEYSKVGHVDQVDVTKLWKCGDTEETHKKMVRAQMEEGFHEYREQRREKREGLNVSTLPFISVSISIFFFSCSVAYPIHFQVKEPATSEKIDLFFILLNY